MSMKSTYLIVGLLLLTSGGHAKDRKQKASTLGSYLSRVQTLSSVPTRAAANGSLWDSTTLYSDLASDHKARKVGDIVVIRITEQLLAESSASVASQRKLEADSGVSALAGKINTAGVESLFSPHSNQALQGKGQTSSKSLLQTSVSGRIVAVLPGDLLVIEAERNVAMNNERQKVVLRGVARVADVTQDNAVLSTQLSNLEVEVSGKGIISDSTRPPMFLVRWLLKIFGM